jgi:hypothetical protein
MHAYYRNAWPESDKTGLLCCIKLHYGLVEQLVGMCFAAWCAYKAWDFDNAGGGCERSKIKKVFVVQRAY